MSKHESKLQTASWSFAGFLACFVLVVIQHLWSLL
jgi:hypothetical protein